MTRFRRWLAVWWPAATTATHLVVTPTPARTLTLAQWRASEHLVAEWRRLLANPALSTALDVLRTESPVNDGFPRLGIAPTDRIVHQALIEGYHLCLNNLEALGIVEVGETQVEATFEPPDPLP